MTHTVVVDLSYGDAGKGTTVDWLCSPARRTQPVSVVRFNGGAQAAHNVVTLDGRHHTFAQFGSGTFWGVPTFLSRFMLVEPLALSQEAEHLSALGVPDPLDLLSADREALLTTPYHAAANRARERSRGEGRHGSCGMGIGETMMYLRHAGEDAPRVGDCERPAVLRGKLERLRRHVQDEHGGLQVPEVETVLEAYVAFAQRVQLVDRTHLQEALQQGEVVFEGAQGVLLDAQRGFHPYTTWSNTTYENAEELLAEAGCTEEVRRLGVVRTYTTRHGPGPFVGEDLSLGALLPEPHNSWGRWQGGFRVGHFDAVAHRYAIEAAGGVDAVALTHLDAPLRAPLRAVDEYLVGGERTSRIVPGDLGDLVQQEALTNRLLEAAPVHSVVTTPWEEAAAALLGAPVVMTSSGPTWREKREALVGAR